MFVSRIRPINFTQYEHGRLAGTLATSWGNDTFASPVPDFPGFAAGVALHDWGYGVMDNMPIGEAAEDAWLEVMRSGVRKRFANPTTDIVVKRHIRRLLSWDESVQRQELTAEIDQRVGERLPETAVTLVDFVRADKITQICDMISFDFCFGSPQQRTFEVYQRPDAQAATPITYEIRTDGLVFVEPWPFASGAISGIVYAFEREGYPQNLNPLIVPYEILRGSGGSSKKG